MRQATYTDSEGIPQRVLLPDDGAADPREGVPVSLDVRALYPHMPPVFVARLVESLWALGLVEPADFLAPGAPDRIRAALLSVVREDTMSLIARAKEQLAHERR